jgi:hypothetical protein
MDDPAGWAEVQIIGGPADGSTASLPIAAILASGEVNYTHPVRRDGEWYALRRDGDSWLMEHLGDRPLDG